ARLWKVNRTIHELVNDRGFLVSDEEIPTDLATFRATYAPHGSPDCSQLNFVTSLKTNLSVGIKTMRKLLDILEEKSINRSIIVFPGHMKVIVAMTAQYGLEELSTCCETSERYASYRICFWRLTVANDTPLFTALLLSYLWASTQHFSYVPSIQLM
ncbi:hypothetical protein BDN71DRAFT_1401186, partial [Pleurotus eryngii]